MDLTVHNKCMVRAHPPKGMVRRSSPEGDGAAATRAAPRAATRATARAATRATNREVTRAVAQVTARAVAHAAARAVAHAAARAVAHAAARAVAHTSLLYTCVSLRYFREFTILPVFEHLNASSGVFMEQVLRLL